MSDQEILEKIGLSEASEELKMASLEGIRDVADKRLMGILEELLDDEQMEELERRTADGSSLEHNIDWMQRQLSLDVKELYDAAVYGYVDELVAKMADA